MSHSEAKLRSARLARNPLRPAAPYVDLTTGPTIARVSPVPDGLSHCDTDLPQGRVVSWKVQL